MVYGRADGIVLRTEWEGVYQRAVLVVVNGQGCHLRCEPGVDSQRFRACLVEYIHEYASGVPAVGGDCAASGEGGSVAYGVA